MTPGRSRRAAVVAVAAAASAALLAAPPAAAKEKPKGRDVVAAAPAPPAGPALLHAPPPRAPQLESTGVWQAPPVLVAGASAYRAGEFLYQDFLYDDLGASSLYSYPTDPRYAGNAADLVEVRLRLLPDATAVRLTYNAMLDPSLVATTLVLGDSAAPVELPHSAGARAPAELFVTVHGSTAEVDDAATRTTAPAGSAPVAVDLERRQVEVRVPFSLLDPRGRSAFRVAAAAGLWDAAAGSYLVPQPTADATRPGGATGTAPTALFNAAFRYDEPLVGTASARRREAQQAAALADGDLTPFHALVDTTKLAAGASDDMRGQRGGVPVTGFMNRVFASRFEAKQGRGDATSLLPGSCPQPCAPALSGQLQTYSLYVPDRAEPPAGFALTLLLHASGDTQSSLQGAPGVVQLGARGAGSLVLTPEARGPSYFYYGQAAADVFEAWADVARHHRLDAARTAVLGPSMGGYGSYKLAATYPDLFAAAAPVVPCPSAGTGYVPPLAPPGGEASAIVHVVPSFRTVPTLSMQSANDQLCTYPGPSGSSAVIGALDAKGFDYEGRTFWGPEHALVGNLVIDRAQPLADFLEAHRVVRDPAHVEYAVNAHMSQPELGLAADHAHWLSGMAVALPSAAVPVGTVEAFSHGFGVGRRTASPTGHAQALYPDSPYLYTSQWRTTSPGPAVPVADRLELRTRGIATVAVDPVRARLTCAAQVDVDTDVPVAVRLLGCGGERVHLPAGA